MPAKVWTFPLLCLLSLSGLLPLATAQRPDDGVPVYHPKAPVRTAKAKPALPPPSATLVITCDLDCSWSLDGDSQGSIAAGGSARQKLQPGQHFVSAKAQDGSEQMQKDLVLEANRQSVVHVVLAPQREAAQRQQSERQQAERRRQEEEQAHQQQAERQQQDHTRQSTATQHTGTITAQLQFKQATDLYRVENFRDAYSLAVQACNGGNLPACDLLGDMYRYGKGVQTDRSRAAQAYQIACDGGLSAGCIDAEIIRQPQRQLNSQNTDAVTAQLQFQQARTLYQNGNFTDAYLLARQACEANSLPACDLLGDMYKYGKGVQPDRAQAYQAYQKACSGGLSTACLGARTTRGQ